MTHVDPYFRKLTGNYLFSEISRQVAQFQAIHPEKRLIRLGIGDVTRPLPAAVVEAMTAAAAEQGTPAGFHGYGPEQGYPFLREAIALHDYQDRGIHVDPDEIFVSDGAKCDSGNIQVRPGVLGLSGHQRHGGPGGGVRSRHRPLVRAPLPALYRGK